MSELSPDTKRVQLAMADYCRHPDEVSIPGENMHRMHHYRRLIFNVIAGALETAYPVTEKYLGSSWKQLTEDFVAHHPCSDPQIWRMPGELIEFLEKNSNHSLYSDLLLDLLRLEWSEIELFMMEDREVSNRALTSLDMGEVYQLQSNCQLLAFKYPVHRVPPSSINLEEKGLHIVLGYRDHETGIVHYIGLTPVVGLTLSMLHNNTPLIDAAQSACQQMGISWSSDYEKALSSALRPLIEKNLITEG